MAGIWDAFVVQHYEQGKTVGWQVPPIGRLTPQQKGQALGMLLWLSTTNREEQLV